MSDYLNNATLVREGTDCGCTIYRLQAQNLHNRYYAISSEGTQRLMAFPEVVGFDSYKSMVPATTAGLNYLKKQGLTGDSSILTILRGGLNYPLEECCHASGLQVSTMNFLSCERIIVDHVITGLDIKYEKLRIQKDMQLMIGDIVASGDTLKVCFKYLIDKFKANGGSIRRIIFFTVGGTRAFDMMESLYDQMHQAWPQFEGFDCFFYEGIFTVYTDKGCTGVNIPMIDFGWKGGAITPEFRSFIMKQSDALFEKCIIYDGGARRYEITEHIEEVKEYWSSLAAVAQTSDYRKFIEEKIGYAIGTGYVEWLSTVHLTDSKDTQDLYKAEQQFIEESLKRNLKDITSARLQQFTNNMHQYE